MEMRPQAPMLLASLVVLTYTVFMASCEPKRHVVGGRRNNGWAPGVNYTDWASKEQFYVGDWLGKRLLYYLSHYYLICLLFFYERS